VELLLSRAPDPAGAAPPASGKETTHFALRASPWVQRWSHLVAPGARVLDVACGAGRHLRWFARRGCGVTGVDRDASALALAEGSGAELVRADIESSAWPFPGRRFDAVVVTNYLWRALMPVLVDSVEDGGVLIYETFAQGNEHFGRPANPDHLLRAGELLALVAPALRPVAFEDGFLGPPGRCVQRIVAVRDAPGACDPARWRLEPPPAATAQPASPGG
jgi:SAM-dependent methyltransferase